MEGEQGRESFVIGEETSISLWEVLSHSLLAARCRVAGSCCDSSSSAAIVRSRRGGAAGETWVIPRAGAAECFSVTVAPSSGNRICHRGNEAPTEVTK